MAISDIPILSMLRTRMHWHQERQQVLSENVANADTREFRPRDLEEPSFSRPAVAASAVTLARTAPAHIGSIAGESGRFQARSKGSFEIRPAGNAVNLEEEMMKVASNQMDYQAATSLYTRTLGLVKTAIGKR